jgi:hypothetical protein
MLTVKNDTYLPSTYGQIEEIWELDYGGDLRIPIFWCQWVKLKAVVVDEYGLSTVELQSVGYKDDQWVLANRVVQVAYYAKPKESKMHVVVSGKQRIVGADGVQSPKEYNHYAEFSLFTDHPCKIKKVENRVNKTGMKPWFRSNGTTTITYSSCPNLYYYYNYYNNSYYYYPTTTRLPY